MLKSRETPYNMKKAPYLLYSPDFIPLDFFLFDYIRWILIGQHFENQETFFEIIQLISNNIEESTLTMIFLEWIIGFSKFIDINDEHVKQTKEIFVLNLILLSRC
jgi:hypothetical protein